MEPVELLQPQNFPAFARHSARRDISSPVWREGERLVRTSRLLREPSGN